MDLTVLLNPLNAQSDELARLLDPTQIKVRLWALEDELLRKASTYARISKLDSSHLILNSAQLAQLDDDRTRLIRLMMRLVTVDELLAGLQGHAVGAAGGAAAGASGSGLESLDGTAKTAAGASGPGLESLDGTAKKRRRSMESRRQNITLPDYIEKYKDLISSSTGNFYQEQYASVSIESTLVSEAKFGALDLDKQPLLKFDPVVGALVADMRQRASNMPLHEQQQYIWSWSIYFIRHIC